MGSVWGWDEIWGQCGDGMRYGGSVGDLGSVWGWGEMWGQCGDGVRCGVCCRDVRDRPLPTHRETVLSC